MNKRSKRTLSRKEVRVWFQPVSDFCRQALVGEVTCVGDDPIVWVSTRRVHILASQAVNGLVSTLVRLLPNFNYQYMNHLEHKLNQQLDFYPTELENVLRSLNLLEGLVIEIPTPLVSSAVLAEMNSREIKEFNNASTTV